MLQSPKRWLEKQTPRPRWTGWPQIGRESPTGWEQITRRSFGPMHSPAIGQRGCSNNEFRSWKAGWFVPDRLIEHTAEPGLRNIDAGIHMACYLVEQRNV